LTPKGFAHLGPHFPETDSSRASPLAPAAHDGPPDRPHRGAAKMLKRSRDTSAQWYCYGQMAIVHYGTMVSICYGYMATIIYG
jgi:hypothetical protein